MALSPRLREKAELMAGLTLTNRILGFVNPPVIGQHIMAKALGSQVDLSVYAARRKAMAEVLRDAGYEFQMPAGAFYFFPKAPGGDDVAFGEQAAGRARAGRAPARASAAPATSAWPSAWTKA